MARGTSTPKPSHFAERSALPPFRRRIVQELPTTYFLADFSRFYGRKAAQYQCKRPAIRQEWRVRSGAVSGIGNRLTNRISMGYSFSVRICRPVASAALHRPDRLSQERDRLGQRRLRLTGNPAFVRQIARKADIGQGLNPGPPVDVAHARLNARIVRHVDMSDVRPDLANRRRRVDLLDMHVEKIGQQRHAARRPRLLDDFHAVLLPPQQVLLVTVERLKQQQCAMTVSERGQSRV